MSKLGNPKREARRERAYARGGSLPGTQPNPEGSKEIRRMAALEDLAEMKDELPKRTGGKNVRSNRRSRSKTRETK